MSFQAKLYNPTPYDVKLDRGRGVKLVIPADGSVDLSMGQLDDYVPGKPGSEEVKRTLDWHGIFLRDPDLSFDSQALLALRSTYKQKKAKFDEFVTSTMDGRISTGRPADEETITALKAKAGYGPDGLGGVLALLDKRIKMLEAEQVKENPLRTIDQLDPDLTCFGVQPPRSFESKLQLKMFLSNQSPTVVEEHEAFIGALKQTQNEGVVSEAVQG